MNRIAKQTLTLLIVWALIVAAPVRAWAALPVVPVAVSFSTAVAINAQTVLQLQGSDADGTALTYATLSSPSHGALSNLNTSTGAIVYTPTAGYTGTDSFTYRVTSGGENSNTATVSITVTAAKTRIIDTFLNPDGTPRTGRVTFILTLAASSPSGIIPAKATASATLNSSGQFDISVFPSKALNPVQYYQVWHDDTARGSTQLLGVYDIPASTTTITLTGRRITDTNLAAQYVFASKAEVDALTGAVAAATTAQLYPGLTSGKHIMWNGTTFANSLISESGATVTVTGNLAVTGTLPNIPAANITSGTLDAARIPGLDASKITSGEFALDRFPPLDGSNIETGTIDDARLPTTQSGKTFESPIINNATANNLTINGVNFPPDTTFNTGAINASGSITAPSFFGNGSGLTGVTGAGVGGTSSTGALSLVADSDNNGPALMDFIIGTTTYGRFNATGEFSVLGRGGQLWTPHAQSVYNFAEFVSTTQAITTTSAAPSVLEIAQTMTVAANVTIPATTTVRVKPGGSITINTGVTLTIQGPIEATPNQKIFNNALAGQGTVSFSGNRVMKRFPWAWFGVVCDSATDDTAAAQAAIDAADDADAGVVIETARTYPGYCRFDTPLVLDSMEAITFEGANPGRVGSTDTGGTTRTARSEWRYFGTGNPSFISMSSSANITFRNLMIRYNSPSFTGDLISMGGSVSTENLFDGVLLGGAGGSASPWESNAVNSRCLLLLRNTTEIIVQDSVLTLARRGICGRADAAPGVAQSGTGFANGITITRTRFTYMKGHPTLDLSGGTVYGGYQIVQPGADWDIVDNIFELDDDPAGKGRAITTEDVIVMQDATHQPTGVNIVRNGFYDSRCGGVWIQIRGAGINIQNNWVTLYNGPVVTGCGGSPSDGQFVKLYGSAAGTATTGLTYVGNSFAGSVTANYSTVYLDVTSASAGYFSNITWAGNAGDGVPIPPPPGLPYSPTATTGLHYGALTTLTTNNAAMSFGGGFYFWDASGGNRTFILPPAITPFTGFSKGRQVCGTKTDSSANTVTITGNVGTETVDGVATSYALAVQGQTVCFINTDGTNWLATTEGSAPTADSPRTGADAQLQVPQTPLAGTPTTDVISDSANQVKCWRFTSPESQTFTKITIRIAVAGNIAGLGLYSTAGAKLASADSISITGATTNVSGTLSGSVTIDKKLSYYICWAADTTTPTAGSTSVIAAGNNALLNVPATNFATAANPMAAGVMPATLGSLTAIVGADAIPILWLHN